jgi:hypothetical protein
MPGLDAVMDLIYMQLRLELRRRLALHLLKKIRSDHGWNLKEPLVALPLPVPLAPLPPPLALLLSMPLLLPRRCTFQKYRHKPSASLFQMGGHAVPGGRTRRTHHANRTDPFLA